MSCLVLIDGNAILHRAFHALPPLTNRAGELVNAVYGFSTMLLKVINDLKPDFLAVAFDTPEPTFRKMEYLGYQAKRPAMDEGLVGQIEKVREVVKAFGIPIFQAPGFEADDVIGTLARQACQKSKIKNQKSKIDEVIIVTGDRDMIQLVGPKVKVYAPGRRMSGAEGPSRRYLTGTKNFPLSLPECCQSGKKRAGPTLCLKMSLNFIKQNPKMTFRIFPN